jgi:hypothetical protein
MDSNQYDGSYKHEPLQSTWIDRLTTREHAQIVHARHYAEQFSSAGVPGHNHLLLIAKLADMLDEWEAHEHS